MLLLIVKLLAQIENAFLVATNGCPSVKTNRLSAAPHLEMHIPIGLNSVQKPTDAFFHTSLGFFRCLNVFLLENEHFVPNMQPASDL